MIGSFLKDDSLPTWLQRRQRANCLYEIEWWIIAIMWGLLLFHK